MKSYLLLTWVVFIPLLQTVCSQLQCHQCANKDNPDCVDPYDGVAMAESYLGDCPPKNTHCTKFKSVNYLYDSGFILGKPRVSVTVSRGCSRANDGYDSTRFGRDGCVAITTDSGFMLVCTCSENGCNSASTLIASLLLTLFSGLGVCGLKNIV